MFNYKTPRIQIYQWRRRRRRGRSKKNNKIYTEISTNLPKRTEDIAEEEEEEDWELLEDKTESPEKLSVSNWAGC